MILKGASWSGPFQYLLKANIKYIEPYLTEKFIQFYCSLNGTAGNPNIVDCNKNG